MTNFLSNSVLSFVFGSAHGVSTSTIAQTLGYDAAKVLEALEPFIQAGEMRRDRRDAGQVLAHQRVYTMRERRGGLMQRIQSRDIANDVLGLVKWLPHRTDVNTVAKMLNISIPVATNTVTSLKAAGLLKTDSRRSQFFYTNPERRDEIARRLSNPVAIVATTTQEVSNMKINVLRAVKNAPHAVYAGDVSSTLGISTTEVTSKFNELISEGLIRRDSLNGKYYTEPSRRADIARMLETLAVPVAPAPTPAPAPVAAPRVTTPRPSAESLEISILRRIKEAPHAVAMSTLQSEFGLAGAQVVNTLLISGLLRRDRRDFNMIFTEPSKRAEIDAKLSAAPITVQVDVVGVPTPAPVVDPIRWDLRVLRFVKESPTRQSKEEIYAAVPGVPGEVLDTLISEGYLKADRRDGKLFTNPEKRGVIATMLATPRPSAPTVERPGTAVPAVASVPSGDPAVRVLRFIKNAPHRQSILDICTGLGLTGDEVEEAIDELVGFELIVEDSRRGGMFYTNPDNQEDVREVLDADTLDVLTDGTASPDCESCASRETCPSSTAATPVVDGELLQVVYRTIKDAPHSVNAAYIVGETGLSVAQVNNALEVLEDAEAIIEHRDGGKYFTNPDSRDLLGLFF